MESLRRGASGMDAARGVKGHGWPLYGDPRSGGVVNEPGAKRRAGCRGKAFLVTFEGPAIRAFGKSDSPSRAKPGFQATRQ